MECPDHSRAYNSFRLESKYGGKWHHGRDEKGYQDHWMVACDGSVWRPRKPLQYYTWPSNKLMMIRSDLPCNPF